MNVPFDVVEVPIATLPDESILILSKPPVDAAIVFGRGNQKPVSRSPVFAIEGNPVEPSPNAPTPVTVRRASGEIVPIPISPVDVILTLSTPPVDAAIVLERGNQKPVSRSPVFVIDGNPVAPSPNAPTPATVRRASGVLVPKPSRLLESSQWKLVESHVYESVGDPNRTEPVGISGVIVDILIFFNEVES